MSYWSQNSVAVSEEFNLSGKLLVGTNKAQLSKGQLIGVNNSNNVQIQDKGTNGYFLMANSNSALGFDWQSVIPTVDNWLQDNTVAKMIEGNVTVSNGNLDVSTAAIFDNIVNISGHVTMTGGLSVTDNITADNVNITGNLTANVANLINGATINGYQMAQQPARKGQMLLSSNSTNTVFSLSQIVEGFDLTYGYNVLYTTPAAATARLFYDATVAADAATAAATAATAAATTAAVAAAASDAPDATAASVIYAQTTAAAASAAALNASNLATTAAYSNAVANAAIASTSNVKFNNGNILGITGPQWEALPNFRIDLADYRDFFMIEATVVGEITQEYPSDYTGAYSYAMFNIVTVIRNPRDTTSGASVFGSEFNQLIRASASEGLNVNIKTVGYYTANNSLNIFYPNPKPLSCTEITFAIQCPISMDWRISVRLL